MRDPVTIAYKDIPGFPRSTVQGHAGQFVIGYIHEVLVVCMQGRFHFYEGYDIGTVSIEHQHINQHAIIVLALVAYMICYNYRERVRRLQSCILLAQSYVNFTREIILCA